MSELEVRELDIRAVSAEERTITGIAVPYGQTANIGHYQERFAPNSVELAPTTQLFWRHEEPIGLVLAGRETAEGYEVTARISETPRGNEAYTLVRDGVINKFSIGFQAVEHKLDKDDTVVRTKVLVREISLVPVPAYEGASVKEVRDLQNSIDEVPKELPKETKESNNMDNVTNPLAEELNEVRESQSNIKRELEIVKANFLTTASAPAADTRTAGQVLKAIAAGDEATIREYTGGTTESSVMLNTFIGDLTRIVDSPIGVRGLISTGVLPPTGNILEYAKLNTNTVAVDEQEAEGDDLTYGQVTLTTETAPVKTFGGYTTLSRQAIERSSVNFLDAHMRAMAVAVSNNLNGYVRSAFSTQHAAHVTAGGAKVINMGITGTDLKTASYVNWLDALVEGADKFERNGWAIDALVLSKDVFKALMALEGSDGRPLLVIQGNTGSNTVGQVNPLLSLIHI